MIFNVGNVTDLLMVSGSDAHEAARLWAAGPKAILFHIRNRPHRVFSEWLVKELEMRVQDEGQQA